MKSKKLGILGGMGPMATVFFYKKLLELTPAKKDQDHIETVIYSNTKIADRTQCISKKNFDSIVLDLIKSAKLLEKCGIDIIVMPCNTAHYFAKDIQKSISIPFINMISETVKYLISFKGIKKIGVLGTISTMKNNLYANALISHNIETICPNDLEQKIVMSVINSIKSGNIAFDQHFLLKPIIDSFKNQDVQKILLGCTELPLIYTKNNLSKNYTNILVDPMDILAKKVINELVYK